MSAGGEAGWFDAFAASSDWFAPLVGARNASSAGVRRIRSMIAARALAHGHGRRRHCTVECPMVIIGQREQNLRALVFALWCPSPHAKRASITTVGRMLQTFAYRRYLGGSPARLMDSALA